LEPDCTSAGEPARDRAGRTRGTGARARRLDPAVDAAILEATLASLAERGYDRTSIDDIAARARVGKAAIYRRWPSKPAVVADAIAFWRRGAGPVTAPDTGTLAGDLEALTSAIPSEDDVGRTMQLILGVATAATRDPSLAAALDELALSQPREIMRTILDRAARRGEIPPGRDLSLAPDVVLGLNVLRLVTGRPLDRVYVRRVLFDVLLPLATAPEVQQSG
jgi:AcrR family transcriptional regulator